MRSRLLLFAPVMVLSCWSHHSRVLYHEETAPAAAALALTGHQLPISTLPVRPAVASEPETKAAGPAAKAAIDFKAEVQPIFVKRCTPCHFPGGSMHEKLPFDDPATISRLGQKVFSRIKAEDERAVIRAFLAERPRG
jgi:hypothetical protein